MQASPLRPWPVALAGLVALAVAMGIGRFAFTPLLPMMMADGSVTLAQASWLASGNYLGYLLGALLCTALPWLLQRVGRPAPDAPRLIRAGLLATAVLTLGMALPLPGVWLSLRMAAGVASAFVFVFTSGWCLAQLARMGHPDLGAIIYVGPGAGIVASGLAASALVALDGSAMLGWAVFGGLAAALSAGAWRVFLPSPAATSPAAAGQPASAFGTAARHGTAEVALLTLAYGLSGFGYIITATFLPVIARQALPNSAWLDLFWPLFGVGVMLGAVLASRLGVGLDRRKLLAFCYGVQAVGVGASVLSPTLAGFALGSLLLGLPFTAITFFAMQEVRRVRPQHAASIMGLLTATYGLGQIAGPPLAVALAQGASRSGQGFGVALAIAASALLLGAALFAWMARAYPLRR